MTHETRPNGTRSQADQATTSLRQLEARREASRRLAPLSSGAVDPWAEQVREPLPIRNDAKSTRATWRYLQSLGLASNAPGDLVSETLAASMRGVA